jgi:hypothetical protein
VLGNYGVQGFESAINQNAHNGNVKKFGNYPRRHQSQDEALFVLEKKGQQLQSLTNAIRR